MQIWSNIEHLRRDKIIRSSLEADLIVKLDKEENYNLLADLNLTELLISSNVTMSVSGQSKLPPLVESSNYGGGSIEVIRTANHKCGRCWRHLPEVAEDGALCGRCEDVVGG